MFNLAVSADLPDNFVDIFASVKGYEDHLGITKEEFVKNYYLNLVKEDVKFVYEVNERNVREDQARIATEQKMATLDNLFSVQ